MKPTLWAAFLILLAEVAYAGDLLDSLRQLRNTVNEVTRTGRELNDLKNSVAPGTSGESQAPQQPRQQAGSTAGMPQAGDVLIGKVANIKIYREANKQSDALGQVSKTEELIYMGEEMNGLYRVTTASGEGWVDKLLVRKN